jgi:hypothetical protein
MLSLPANASPDGSYKSGKRVYSHAKHVDTSCIVCSCGCCSYLLAFPNPGIEDLKDFLRILAWKDKVHAGCLEENKSMPFNLMCRSRQDRGWDSSRYTIPPAAVFALITT